MNCKDCLHYDVCGGYTLSDLDCDVFHYAREGRADEIPDIEERCSGFKDKSRFVELPCKVGDTLFVLSTCYDIVSFPGDGVICPYENVCHIEDCTNYNDVLRPFPMTVECLTIGDHGICSIFFEESSTEYLSTEIGKTVFLTREEAEKALAERSNDGKS